jgi:hypothetical protein
MAGSSVSTGRPGAALARPPDFIDILFHSSNILFQYIQSVLYSRLGPSVSPLKGSLHQLDPGPS